MKRHIQLFSMILVAVVVLSGAVWTSSAQAAAVCQQYHSVQPGENLFRISLRYGTTVPALMSLNQLANASLIYVGQQLCVSGTVSNPVPAPAPIPGNQPTYTVQRGDTLYSIARRYNVPTVALAQANGITNYNLIYVGQVLRIPTTATNNDEVIPTPPQYLVALVNVNLRSGPGFNFAVEGQMRAGEQAHVTGMSQDGQWWRVTCVTDISGNCWVSSNRLLTLVVALPQAPG